MHARPTGQGQWDAVPRDTRREPELGGWWWSYTIQFMSVVVSAIQWTVIEEFSAFFPRTGPVPFRTGLQR